MYQLGIIFKTFEIFGGHTGKFEADVPSAACFALSCCA